MSEEKAPGYHLTKPEARQLMALARERERERVQAEMEEIGEAFGEMAGRLAVAPGEACPTRAPRCPGPAPG